MSNILLINGIMQAIDDLQVRLHYRSLMESSGLHALVDLLRTFGMPAIDKQLDLLQQVLGDDEKNLESSMELDMSCDLSNVDEVFRALRSRTKDSNTQEYLLSTLQHLLLLPADPDYVLRFQLIDSLVSELVMDDKLGCAERRIGLSVDRMIEQFKQLENAKALEDELIRSRSAALHLKAENEDLQERFSHAEFLAISLQAENNRLQAMLSSYSSSIGKPGFPASPQKENMPPTTQFMMSRLNFRGLSSWFGSPQASLAMERSSMADELAQPEALFRAS
jgi:hypothetical protein